MENEQHDIVDLQLRITDQEAAIEELTRRVLAMDKRLSGLENQLAQLQTTLREALPALVAKPSDEGPPPHY